MIVTEKVLLAEMRLPQNVGWAKADFGEIEELQEYNVWAKIIEVVNSKRAKYLKHYIKRGRVETGGTTEWLGKLYPEELESYVLEVVMDVDLLKETYCGQEEPYPPDRLREID